jgi:hypothetical protein
MICREQVVKEKIIMTLHTNLRPHSNLFKKSGVELGLLEFIANPEEKKRNTAKKFFCANNNGSIMEKNES